MIRHLVTVALATAAGLVLTADTLHGAQPSPPVRVDGTAALRNGAPGATRIADYAHLGLGFEENRGQAVGTAKFVAHAGRAALLLGPHAIVFAPDRGVPLRMRFVGANPAPSMVGATPLPGHANYLIGNRPEQWHTHIPTWSQVRYEHLYRGVDLAVYGDREHLEYDLIAAPGAHLEDVRLRFDGAERLEVDRDGDLIVHTRTGQLRHHKPVIYQESARGRRPIPGGYVLTGPLEVGVQVAAYDRQKPLIVDPELSYSTYLGGDVSDMGFAIAADARGNAYVTGTTRSANFPTANPLQPVQASVGADAFVTKIDASGALVFSTYLGGTGIEDGVGVQAGIAVDGDGNVYVTGTTQSSDFPLENPAQSNPSVTGLTFGLAFVSKLDPSGAALMYSTYLGGSTGASGAGIAVDTQGNAYVAGEAGQDVVPGVPDAAFPTTKGAYQTICTAAPTCNGSTPHGFLTKFDPDGGVVYSTLLGGNDTDIVRGVAVDRAGNAYLTGATYSDQGFPLGGLQPALAGGADAFVAKLDASGSHLVYFTYLGGSGGLRADGGYGIALGGSDSVYIVGQTFAPDFPTTAGVVQPGFTDDAVSELFLAKLDLSASALRYSTFLPGCKAAGVALDTGGNAYVLGQTNSTCPITPVEPLQALGGGIDTGADDAFVTVVNPTGTTLLFSTPLGGAGYELGLGIAVDPSGHIYATGATSSADFPTVHAVQTLLKSPNLSNAYVARISPAVELPPPGDANCDLRVTAADLTALAILIGDRMAPACPTADANDDGVVDEPDVPAAIAAIFAAGA